MTPDRRRPPTRRRSSEKKKSHPPVEELHPVAEPPDIGSFRELDLAPDIQEAIAAMGIVEPTPIQKLAIQPVLEGRDVIAKAETGTGKTLAFGAPMMSKVDTDRSTVLGLVLCPTRELAQQVHDVLTKLGEARGIGVALVVGGDPMHPQVDDLRAGCQIVVGTPGRVLDLMGQRFLSFPWTEFAVLDEADEMLEIGFLDDVRKILAACPPERQTLLFSATFPPELLRLAREHTRDPIEVATAKGVVSVEGISHYYVEVDDKERADALKRIIAGTDPDDVLLVFCDRRVEVERLMRTLERTRWPVKALHGGYDQAARFRVMSAFRDREVKVLVATDVASRGLDVAHVSHVVNYSAPRDITDYTHRTGRTGRAGRAGRAITLVSASEHRRWRAVRERMTWPLEELELPEGGAGGRGRGRGRSGEGRRGSPREARRRGDGEERGRDEGSRERGGRARRDSGGGRDRQARGEDRGERRPRDEAETGRGSRRRGGRGRSRGGDEGARSGSPVESEPRSGRSREDRPEDRRRKARSSAGRDRGGRSEAPADRGPGGGSSREREPGRREGGGEGSRRRPPSSEGGFGAGI